jgi:hypothetical protein
LEDHVDQQLKELIKELGAAIDKSLSDSKRIGEVASRTKERGYDIGLNLEATIRVSKQGRKTSGGSSKSVPISLRVGEYVKVGPKKPDGMPHPNAGKTGTVHKLLPCDSSTPLRAIVQVDNGLIVVSVQCLEVLQ